MSGKIDCELSVHAVTVMAERDILEYPLGREVENIALSAIVCFAAG
jgi:hypothetical protein